MENETIVKKPRKSAVKKEIAEAPQSQDIPVKRNLIKRLNKKKPVEEEKKEEPKKEDYKGSVILAVDPAFKKCGFGIIRLDNGAYVDSF